MSCAICYKALEAYMEIEKPAWKAYKEIERLALKAYDEIRSAHPDHTDGRK